MSRSDAKASTTPGKLEVKTGTNYPRQIRSLADALAEAGEALRLATADDSVVSLRAAVELFVQTPAAILACATRLRQIADSLES